MSAILIFICFIMLFHSNEVWGDVEVLKLLLRLADGVEEKIQNWIKAFFFKQYTLAKQLKVLEKFISDAEQDDTEESFERLNQIFKSLTEIESVDPFVDTLISQRSYVLRSPIMSCVIKQGLEENSLDAPLYIYKDAKTGNTIFVMPILNESIIFTQGEDYRLLSDYYPDRYDPENMLGFLKENHRVASELYIKPLIQYAKMLRSGSLKDQLSSFLAQFETSAAVEDKAIAFYQIYNLCKSNQEEMFQSVQECKKFNYRLLSYYSYLYYPMKMVCFLKEDPQVPFGWYIEELIQNAKRFGTGFLEDKLLSLGDEFKSITTVWGELKALNELCHLCQANLGEIIQSIQDCNNYHTWFKQLESLLPDDLEVSKDVIKEILSSKEELKAYKSEIKREISLYDSNWAKVKNSVNTALSAYFREPGCARKYVYATNKEDLCGFIRFVGLERLLSLNKDPKLLKFYINNFSLDYKLLGQSMSHIAEDDRKSVFDLLKSKNIVIETSQLVALPKCRKRSAKKANVFGQCSRKKRQVSKAPSAL